MCRVERIESIVMETTWKQRGSDGGAGASAFARVAAASRLWPWPRKRKMLGGEIEVFLENVPF